jgi:DnaJ family protein C protein 7
MKMEKLKKEATDLFQAQNFKEAIERFGECLELDPLNVQYNSTILFIRAVAYSKLALNKEALGDLNSAIDLNDDYTKAYIKRGEINLVLENFD